MNAIHEMLLQNRNFFSLIFIIFSDA